MKKYKCDNCGSTHPLAYLTVDRETRDYLCPTCYSKSKVIKDNSEIVSAVLFVVLIAIFLFIFGYFADKLVEIVEWIKISWF